MFGLRLDDSNIPHKRPIINDPIRLTMSVPIGNIQSKNLYEYPDTEYLKYVPIAPPTRINKIFVILPFSLSCGKHQIKINYF